jgi:hypothetical protein
MNIDELIQHQPDGAVKDALVTLLAELTLARAVVETARGWGMFVAQMDSGKLIREIEAYDAVRGGREG